jgi:D-amino peptidase
MRVHVSIDMEGVAGIVERRQCWRGGDDYALGRDLMAGEANAAVEGAFDAGATEVVVNDAHGDMCNLRPQDLDPRALLQSGQKMPDAMVHRAGTDADVVLFVGYHAGPGVREAVLEHAYSSGTVAALRVDGREWGELELNAAVLGVHGVPVAVVTGDDKVCAAAEACLPGVTVVPVKQGLGNRSARSLSPSVARTRIREGVARALAGPWPEPIPVGGPLRLEVEFLTTLMAESAALLPGSTRTAPRTVAYDAPDVTTLSRARGVLLALAASS